MAMTAKKTVVSTAPAKPDNQVKPETRHIVLKMSTHRELHGADAAGNPVYKDIYRPIFSAEHGDESADDQIAAIKVEKINEARASAAPIPKFRIVHEIAGQEVEPV